MKEIVAIIRPEKLDDLKVSLGEMGVHGMTVYEVQGCGNQRGLMECGNEDGSGTMLNMIPKVKVELVVKNSQVESLIKRISSVAHTGEVGDGKIFVYPVEECVRIRTGERSDRAV